MNVPEFRCRNLLNLALPVLDHVFGALTDQNAKPPWTLGGGTAIALWIDHRISYDVDLFVPGVALKLFTPVHNPFTARISPHSGRVDAQRGDDADRRRSPRRCVRPLARCARSRVERPMTLCGTDVRSVQALPRADDGAASSGA